MKLHPQMAPWEQVPSNMMQTKQQIQGYLLFVSGPKLYCLEKLKGNFHPSVCVRFMFLANFHHKEDKRWQKSETL